jgi:hypothetical protein
VGFGRGKMASDAFASGAQESRFKEGQHVVVKWKAGARLAGLAGAVGCADPSETIPVPGVAHASVTKIDGVGIDLVIDEGICRGLSLCIDVMNEDENLRSVEYPPQNRRLEVLPNTDLGVVTWLLERSSIASTTEASIPPDLARQGLIPKSFNDTLDRIFGAVKKARLHDHTLRNPTVTDIESSEILMVVDLVRQDLTIHPDAWVFSQGNGRFDVHIEPGLYYTFYT